jgi:hypothetical protein
MSWINLTALWQIVVLGLVAGAGSGSEASVGGNPVGIAAAGFCFLIVLAAIGWGIWAIWVAGHPK